MRHLRCIVNFGYHLPAKEIIVWRKQLLKVKILEFGHTKLAVRAVFEKRY